MILLKLCRNILLRPLVVMAIISSLIALPAFCQETEDSQVFIAGFNAYQQKDYASSIEKMDEVLKKYPDTPLRDMALFWLSQSYYKAGNQQEAARYFSQFSKEYPENPLKSTVEEDLLTLTARYEKGEKLPVGPPLVKQSDLLAAQKIKAEQERSAAAESARVTELKQAEEKAAADKKERERIAQAETELVRMNALKAERERNAAAEKAERERIALVKAEEAKQLATAAEKKEQERIAQTEAELVRMNALKTESERRAAAEKAERERVALIQAEEARQTAVAAEAAHVAALKQAEEKKAVAEKKEQERIAQTEAELARMNALKAESERVALGKAEEAKRAAAAAEAERMASRKAEQERQTEERVAKNAEAARQAALKDEETRLAQQKRAEEKINAARLSYRAKAISQYKSTIEKYPATSAAASAAAKLRELDVAVALPTQPVEAPLPENAQEFRLEVAQFAGFEFSVLAHPNAYAVGHHGAVPFEITNRGNGKDSFLLASAFPAEFKVRFASAATPDVTITQTPELAPDQSFKGVINLVVPPSSIDGLRITYPVKATSRLMAEASQSREVPMVASAPLLRAVLRAEKTTPLPGDRVVYRVTVLNVGSTVAQDVTFRLSFPPQLEPVDLASDGFRPDTKSAMILDKLQIKSGEARDFNVAFRLKDDSLAEQELLARGELINTPLNTAASFVSNMVRVGSHHSVSVRTASDTLVAIPGQSITVPFVVTNTGNVREKFKITSIVTGITDAVIFHDVNRDGIRQASEPLIGEIGPLAPREEASVAVELKTPASAADNSQATVRLLFASEGDTTSSASGVTQLTYSRPVLKMVMSGGDGRLKPGEIASFDLTITNTGSNISRIVELRSAWAEQLELVASEPVASTVGNGTHVWRFKELGAGEKRNIKVSFRVKPGTSVGTAIRVKNILTYEDQLGNRY